MINTTILVLGVSDCSNEPIVKKWNIDAQVSQNFEASAVGSIKQVFSHVIVYDYLKRYIEVGVRRVNKEILDIVEREHPEFLLWHTMTYEILESTFDRIRHLGTKVIGWFFDDQVRFDEYSKWWIPHLDYCLTVDPEAVPRYENLGVRAIYFPVYSNPDVFRPLNLPKRYDLTFVGSKIADREELMNDLRAQGFLIAVFGRGWDSGYISLEQMIEIYNTSRICLCFTKSYGVKTRRQLKDKIFDICMCGGFLLCEYIPGIEDYFEIDKEIACFNSITDAIQKIKYYLENESKRNQIAEAGYRRAVREHAFQVKIPALFQTISNWDKCHTDMKTEPETRNSIQMKLQRIVRKHKSEFHLKWGKALLAENYKGTRCRDEMLLALSYHPVNKIAWCYYLVGCLPLFIRPKVLMLLETMKKIRRAILGKVNA